MWDWAWNINTTRPFPFVALWARGAAKSTSAELVASMIGMTQRRAYIVYVSGTQDLADKHVSSISNLLEQAGVSRALNKYGSSKGWRRDRLRANDFTIDALGLDTGARGIKVDDDRPGMIILDDVDELHDSAQATAKKIETLTNTILPSGSNECAVLFVQNIIHRDSIAARLQDGRADFLSDRIVSGAYPTLLNFKVIPNVDGEGFTIDGTPTWEGQDLEACRGFVKAWGLDAFKRECQHDVENVAGAIYADAWSDTANVSEQADYVPNSGGVLWGVDDGYVGTWIADAQNYTADSHPRVFLLAQLRPNGTLAIFAEHHAIKELAENQITKVLALGYPAPETVCIDKSAAELRGRLNGAGLYCIGSPSSVDESIKNMRDWIAPDVNGVRKLQIHPRCKLFLKEIKAYSADPNGKLIKAYDHTMDAARYLLWSFRHQG